jgi:hypothetical protein
MASGKVSIAFFVLLMSGIIWATEQDDDDQTATPSYVGQATVLKASVLGAPIVLGDTGPLPSSGDAREYSLLNIGLPLQTLGNISLSLLHASTVGQGDATRSEASVANLGLNVSGITVGAAFLMARANATCRNDEAKSEIIGLTINGQPIVVTGAPNQTINLVLGKVIINEQVIDGDVVTVNAIRVVVAGLVDIAIASAKSGITCQGAPPCARNDFVTGGGFINLAANKKGNFSIGGGIKNNNFWGHLNFIDHNNQMKVHGKTITGYVNVDATTRKISGTADIDGRSGYSFTAVVSDKGEPGTLDTFWLKLSNGYDTTNKKLDGGNIQLHKATCRQ